MTSDRLEPGRAAEADGAGRNTCAELLTAAERVAQYDQPYETRPARRVTVTLDSAGDRERLRRATGSDDPYLRDRLINDMLGCLTLAAGGDAREEAEQLENAIRAALAALEALAPGDAADAMQAVQMVGCHAAAMECLRRAARGEGPAAARDWNLRHAARLMALYERQAAALDRTRAARREERARAERYAEERASPQRKSVDCRPTASAEPPASARPHLAAGGSDKAIRPPFADRPKTAPHRLGERLMGSVAPVPKQVPQQVPGQAPDSDVAAAGNQPPG